MRTSWKLPSFLAVVALAELFIYSHQRGKLQDVLASRASRASQEAAAHSEGVAVSRSANIPRPAWRAAIVDDAKLAFRAASHRLERRTEFGISPELQQRLRAEESAYRLSEAAKELRRSDKRDELLLTLGPILQRMDLDEDKRETMLSLLTQRERCVLDNPVEFVERVDTRAVAREFRRALTSAEVVRLLETAPHPRRVVYRMVVETGLRRCELNGLRWADFRLGAGAESAPDRPEAVAPLSFPSTASEGGSVRVQASISKNRRTVVLPIGPELAADLLTLRAPDTAEFQFVFKGVVPKVPTFRRDLSRTGIAFEDATGRRLDLHALRKTFGTSLVLAGAEPRVVMEAMRHSDLKLTMKTYTDAAQLIGQLESAVKLLPWNQQNVHSAERGAKVTA